MLQASCWHSAVAPFKITLTASQVPIFIKEEKNDFEALLKKSSSFGMGGWWLGGTHMKPNENFLRDVQVTLPSGFTWFDAGNSIGHTDA